MPSAQTAAETATELRQQFLDLILYVVDVGAGRPARRRRRRQRRRLAAFVSVSLACAAGWQADAHTHFDGVLDVDGELDLDRRADRQRWIEILNHHLLDDAVLLEDRHDDASGLVVSAAGAVKDAGQRGADRSDDLLDALAAARQHFDLQRLGDELRRQHRLPQRPSGTLMAHHGDNTRHFLSRSVTDGELQGVVRFRL